MDIAYLASGQDGERSESADGEQGERGAGLGDIGVFGGGDLAGVDGWGRGFARWRCSGELAALEFFVGEAGVVCGSSGSMELGVLPDRRGCVRGGADGSRVAEVGWIGSEHWRGGRLWLRVEGEHDGISARLGPACRGGGDADIIEAPGEMRACGGFFEAGAGLDGRCRRRGGGGGVVFMRGFGEWWPSDDSAVYLGLARSLAEGKGYTFNGQVNTSLSPGLPLALAGIEKVAGEGIWAANLFLALCGLATAGLVYLALRRMTGIGLCR